jgi:SAM-dependent methyltransferase
MMHAQSSHPTSKGLDWPCRACGNPLHTRMVDLGVSPLCQTHISHEQLSQAETFYPLQLYVCERCWLVQLQAFVTPSDIFSEYAYFSSYASSWVEHARRYVNDAIRRFGLGPHSKVAEVASNDGYLLQHFVTAGVPVLGVEPAANVADAARARGIATEVVFLGQKTAQELVDRHGSFDLVLGNNVLAHVPDLNDFVAGLRTLMRATGVLTMEFPHLQRLMEGNQFDTIYHEHFSYFSLLAVEQVFLRQGLVLFDVDELPTHGGSLRIYARHANASTPEVSNQVLRLRDRELALGYDTIDCYRGFASRVEATKRDLLAFLIDAKSKGKRVVGYGAPGKGNTLLNFCGIRTDFLDFTVDANPYKQGKYTPGTRIPILAPDAIAKAKPDYVLILPWNLREEISHQASYIREWGGQFVVPIPKVSVF